MLVPHNMQSFGISFVDFFLPLFMIQVLDATDDEPWGPHGTALAEIATATKKL